MSDRLRFALLISLLAVALTVCMWMSVQRIEQDLTARVQITLAEADVPFFGVEIDGRDALLTGAVSSEEQADRIVRLVSAVEGIRRVDDITTLEPLREPVATSTVAPGTPPRLTLQRVGPTVLVSGTLGDDGEAPGLRSALEERFGEAGVVWSVGELSTTASPAWVTGAARLAEVLSRGAGNVRIVIAGEVATLSGQVPDADSATHLREVALRIPDLSWRFEISTPSGPMGGGGEP